ncbi:ATP-binding protein [Streptomyces spiroverticillatus]|uniref:ATP-binding protein n=1 Tax=Streptomyces finlayi TaxID=67296 RepID=A0A918X1X4_9ACTN|nr:ATP-binding protein [Streptomyces finlayi]GHA21777.1 ATP-binding protein [Streptomyces spiroverticillatus]GHD04013.1 ATP-binding protein [Streptomyces finlayi]
MPDDPGVDPLPLTVGAAYEGSPADIGEARALSRDFLRRVRADYGLPVSERALEVLPLVVSELITNACKYAPGPQLLELSTDGTAIQVSLWDSSPALPLPRAGDADRVGQHGLEIVMALCQGYEVHQQPLGKRTRVHLALTDTPRTRQRDVKEA